VNNFLESNFKIIVPPHAYYEVIRGLEERRAAKQLRLFNGLLDKCPLGIATKEVLNEAGRIYNETRRNGTPMDDDMDILIAAFCRTFGLTLVTNNTGHFINVLSLSLADWTQDADTTNRP
jgi:predicted nucleic acid-binding protein